MNCSAATTLAVMLGITSGDDLAHRPAPGPRFQRRAWNPNRPWHKKGMSQKKHKRRLVVAARRVNRA